MGPPSITPTLRDDAGTLEVGAHSQHPPQDLVLVANTHWAQGSPHVTLNNHARSHGSPQPSGKAWKPEAEHRVVSAALTDARSPGGLGSHGRDPRLRSTKSQKHTPTPSDTAALMGRQAAGESPANSPAAQLNGTR